MTNIFNLQKLGAWKAAVSANFLPIARDTFLTFAKRYLNKRVKKFVFHRGPSWIAGAKEHRAETSPFFQLYPYEGPLRLKSVNAHSVVDLELGIFFHRIPKSANSSLTASVAQIRDGKILSEAQQFKRQLRKSLRRPADLSLEEVESVATLLKFVFVRNPYSRVLSAYSSKVLANWKTDRQIRIDVTSRADVTEPPTFAEFCRFLASGGLYRNHHWYPQIDYLVFPLSNYNFIGRVETIDSDFNRLATLISGKETALRMLPEDPKHRTGATQRVSETYTPELYEMVYEMYKRDFEAFGYAKSHNV